jgi:hypothetical protein
MLDRRGALRLRYSTGAIAALWVLGRPVAALADPAAAEALFREGRRLLDEGRYAEACSKLVESQSQDPASGTLINLALCFEKQGRLATAWAHYRSAAVSARNDGRSDRVAAAERKVAELEPRVPRLVLRAERVLPGMEARWGNVRVGTGAFGTSIPLDPGPYTVAVSAPGYVEFTAAIQVAESESTTLEIPELRAAPAEPRPQSTARKPTVAPARQERPLHEEDSSQGTPRWPGYVVGGAGVAALGVGAFFGVSSLNAYAEAEEACPTHRDCSEEAHNARSEAETKAWAANLTIGAGLVAVGLGAWLVLDASDEDRGAIFVRVTRTARGAELTLGSSL